MTPENLTHFSNLTSGYISYFFFPYGMIQFCLRPLKERGSILYELTVSGGPIHLHAHTNVGEESGKGLCAFNEHLPFPFPFTCILSPWTMLGLLGGSF